MLHIRFCSIHASGTFYCYICYHWRTTYWWCL